MERLADFRDVYAQMVVARGGCPDDEALRRAFATVPRHAFLGPGPWTVAEEGSRTPTDDPALIYQDVGIGLAPSIPTGLPSLHARFLAALHVAPGERVVQVGEAGKQIEKHTTRPRPESAAGWAAGSEV